VRLEDIAVHLRRRSAWEALDLGHAMLHAWGLWAYRAWFATYWPAGIVILLVLWPWPEFAMFLLWWLKPLFDRVLLHVFSRSVFGNQIGVREVLRELPRLLRAPGVLSGLSLRRFSLARSLLLPVWQLEEQRGADARARFKLLGRRCRGHAVWLTVFCANMSSILLVSMLIMLLALVPGDGHELPLWEWFGDEPSGLRHLVGNLVFMLAETIVEPLYVASGFSLYLNRRSELEAWDIELAFRGLAERCSATAGAGPLLVLLPLALGLALLLPSPLFAQEISKPTRAVSASEQSDIAPMAAREAIDAVLADPVFGQVTDDWRWRWREQPAVHDHHGRDWLKALLRAIEFLAEGLRALLWIVAGLALAMVIFLVVRYREKLGGGRAPAAVPEFLCGLDLRPAFLPADIAAAAQAALARGASIEALSLLYRGALVALVDDRQIEFAAGDSENDCRRRVAGRLSEAAEKCFVEVIEVWCLAAYGGVPVAVTRVEDLIADWGRHFAARGVRP
jgi:hypothetical protein